MHTHGHTTVWGPHLGVGRTTDGKSWSQQIRDRWTAYRAARHDAKLARLRSCWDARREALTPCRADAAVDMVAAEHACSTTTVLCALTV